MAHDHEGTAWPRGVRPTGTAGPPMTAPTPTYRMPGGGVSRRPLHFIILADCSGGMKGEKIQALN